MTLLCRFIVSSLPRLHRYRVRCLNTSSRPPEEADLVKPNAQLAEAGFVPIRSTEYPSVHQLGSAVPGPYRIGSRPCENSQETTPERDAEVISKLSNVRYGRPAQQMRTLYFPLWFLLSVGWLVCLIVTLLNVRDCAPVFVKKALEYRNDFDVK